MYEICRPINLCAFVCSIIYVFVMYGLLLLFGVLSLECCNVQMKENVINVHSSHTCKLIEYIKLHNMQLLDIVLVCDCVCVCAYLNVYLAERRILYAITNDLDSLVIISLLCPRCHFIIAAEIFSSTYSERC